MPNATPDHPAPRPKALRFWAWMLGALAIIVLDQLTKIYFDSHLAYGERWHLLPFFDFTLLYNPGAAFSFLADGQGWQRWFFTKSEEHTSELQSLMRISYAVFCLKKKKHL